MFLTGSRTLGSYLISAALIMSVFLLGSSVVTTALIEPHEFEKGGEANGRALAFLAHRYLGDIFGTVYDISTILILAFAGASAMAGLLNLVPRYLPRYGMAPEWALASRPLVLVFIAIAFVVTIAFKADVDAQGGAYATGVLVLMSSAALAVTISAWGSKPRIPFMLITAVFGYTTVLNIVEGRKVSRLRRSSSRSQSSRPLSPRTTRHGTTNHERHLRRRGNKDYRAR